MPVIYTPRGKAREYSPLAINLYNGCSHNCKYCYGKNIRGNPEPVPRKNILKLIEKEAILLSNAMIDDQILLCFLCDPYQHLEEGLKITSQTIDILMKYNLRFTILTKGGKRSIPDMAKYKDYPKASYGVTLFTFKDVERLLQEPYASPVQDRVKALATAHFMEIKTWVSVEPVFYPEDALELIKNIAPITDKFKVGKLNHYPKIEKQIDWKKFCHDAIALLEKLDKEYYIKKDLMEFF